MPQLDFFNILSQIEFGLFTFFIFYFFSIFFVIPTILIIFAVRAFYKQYPLQLFNSYSFSFFNSTELYNSYFLDFFVETKFNLELAVDYTNFNNFLFDQFVLLDISEQEEFFNLKKNLILYKL